MTIVELVRLFAEPLGIAVVVTDCDLVRLCHKARNSL